MAGYRFFFPVVWHVIVGMAISAMVIWISFERWPLAVELSVLGVLWLISAVLGSCLRSNHIIAASLKRWWIAIALIVVQLLIVTTVLEFVFFKSGLAMIGCGLVMTTLFQIHCATCGRSLFDPQVAGTRLPMSSKVAHRCPGCEGNFV
ncbi:MAG: hypothetical protein CVT78_02115 [Alphaproteobacteria bacterium HGW-Alphaproteobacteria-17]|nr:MAG: hypothetical protein CVT78_02115 [Alphaproteobacteria bacterium HGW-Alphaproteobacteria-17]